MPPAEQTRERAVQPPRAGVLQGMLHGRSALAAALVALGLAHLYFHASYTLDDAYITFRYARNLAGGLGLVYNPGDHVKGYSNTLYTLFMTLPELLGSRDPIAFSKRIGALSFVWVCVLGYLLYAREERPELRDRGVYVLAWLATCAALAVHFIGGLETGLHTALVFAAVLRRVREQDGASAPWSALLFAGVVWSRPEGILIFAAATLHDLLWRTRSGKFAGRDLWFYFVPPAAYAAELVLSRWYYGAPFPQTYYAKAGATRDALDALRVLWAGLRAQLHAGAYLARGTDSIAIGWAGWLILPLAFVSRRTLRRNFALLFALLAQLVFVVRAGDDWAPAFRFGVPLIPLFVVLLVEALGNIAALGRGHQRLLLAALTAAGLAFSLPRQWRDSELIQKQQPVNARNKLVQGRSFTALAPAGITLSSFDIGGQGYAAGGFDILDTVGLTVRETTGCRDRMLPRCVRYAELIRPELVRMHNNKRRDAFVSSTVRKLEPYLELDGGKVLLARQLVLLSELPAWARARDSSELGGARLIGDDLPVAVLASEASQLELFWKRSDAAVDPLLARRLEWHGPGGHYSAQASDLVWKRAGSAGGWSTELIFLDRANVVAPAKPGSYELLLVVGSQRLVLDRVEVLAVDPAARRAEQLASQAAASWVGGQALVAFQHWGRSAELGRRAPIGYHAAVAQYAREQRSRAETLVSSDRLAALRLAQQAKRLLHRAYWESGRASAALHHEIEANAELRRKLIEAELESL